MSEEEATSALVQSYARLLSLAVHEFRTPLSVVLGYLRMLRDTDHPLGERQRKMIDEAAKSCARLVGLINELSEVSKLDAGTAVVKEEAFDLFRLIGDVAAGVREAENREVRLVVRGEAAGARIVADPIRVRDAFDALFRAVLREQPAQTTVVAECRRGPSGSAVIVVAREADVQDSYDAAPAPLNEKRGGLGLALPIARRVIARHGGRVWSPDLAGRSDAGLSGGSAILVSLPVTGEHTA